MLKMPVLFAGHGSPMNAIENNRFSAAWKAIGETLPKPKAILSVSAHWFTSGTLVSDTKTPRMIYDMYGFPAELYRVRYPAPGSPEFAALTKALLKDRAKADHSWGLDHGTWSVLRWLYPDADMPVFQLSVDRNASMREHFEIGRKLRALRERGVLILGSGNVVHHLARIKPGMAGGYPWAEAFDGYVRQSILLGKTENVIQYMQAGESAAYAFSTPDHYAPLLYALGASDESDKIMVFNNTSMAGALSMTGYLFS